MALGNLNPLQEKLLEMLKWLHVFCLNNGIEYYAIGGTLLGAVRHQGFIPWDDDIDIAMTRDHYARFQKLMQQDQGKYRLETPMSPAKDYRYPISKLYDTSTTLVENMHPPCKRGVFIDVFPIDGIGNTIEEARRNFSRIYLLSMLLATRNSKLRKARSWYKNAAIVFSRIIPEALLSTKWLARKVDRLCERRSIESSVYVGSMLGSYGLREVFPKRVFGIPRLYAFEDTKIFGLENAEDYLVQVYGNWKELPPFERRGIQHDFLYISLDKSYLID